MKATSKKSAATVKKSTATATTRKATRNQKQAIERNRIDPQLKIVPVVKENPRREGSHGFKSMQVILKARKPLTVEEFEEKGGRLRDLHWDINFGHVKLNGRSKAA
jgi:hypothetical protein